MLQVIFVLMVYFMCHSIALRAITAPGPGVVGLEAANTAATATIATSISLSIYRLVQLWAVDG